MALEAAEAVIEAAEQATAAPLILIRDIFIGRNTFMEFLKSPEKISTSVLVNRTKKLIEYGLIDFRRYS